MSAVLLDQILAPGGLRTVFQPIYRVKSEGKPRLVGVECLTRGPRGTNAENAGVMFEYVRRKRQENVVDRACILSALCAARKLGGSPRISVNAHASTLARDRGFPSFLAEAARKRNIPLDRITLEIVEHGPALDGISFASALAEVRSHKMRVALDDVGVGASNLKMMLDCKPDYFKVDRHFVTDVHSDPGKRAMMEAIVHISRSIGGEVVAEGVETNRELETVAAMGIELIQGYLFCSALETEKLLEREPSLRPSPQPEVN